MVAWLTLASICAAAIPFYLRFLVALCKEYTFARNCYLVRIEPEVDQSPIDQMSHGDELSERAA
jgi:hypothetical protein